MPIPEILPAVAASALAAGIFAAKVAAMVQAPAFGTIGTEYVLKKIQGTPTIHHGVLKSTVGQILSAS